MSCLKEDLELGPSSTTWPDVIMLPSPPPGIQGLLYLQVLMSVLIIKQVIVSMEWADGVRGKVTGDVHVSSLNGHPQTL